MQSIFLAFVTGLTTGGLSCLAVQGGLLASSLGSQIEKDVLAAADTALLKKSKKKRAGAANRPSPRRQYALPIAAFLTAKVLAYTLLGFLLGLVGSMFQLSPLARALLQIAIGIYMVGAALRMFNVHPIFRYFVFEPPAFLRRRIRKMAAASRDDGGRRGDAVTGGRGDAETSASVEAAASAHADAHLRVSVSRRPRNEVPAVSTSLAAPAFLGLLTVLIPCGITQAMMAVALGTGNPLDGAALMLAFTLGTSPVFFAVAYFATRLGSLLEKHFMRFVATVMLILGLVSVDTGLTLAGSPVTFTRVIGGITAGISAPAGDTQAGQPEQDLQVFDPNALGPAVNAPEAGAPGASGTASGTVVTINIKNTGYSPRVSHAKAGVPVKLRLVSRGVYSCALAFIIPSLGVQEYLESTGEKLVDLPAQRNGARIPFSCSMGMYTGIIIFDL